MALVSHSLACGNGSIGTATGLGCRDGRVLVSHAASRTCVAPPALENLRKRNGTRVFGCRWGHPLLRDGCLRRSQGPSSLTGTGCVGSRVCRGRHRALPWCCGRRGGRLRHTGSFGHSVGHLYAYGTKKDLHNSTHSYFRGSNCWVVYLCEAEYYMVYWMTTKVSTKHNLVCTTCVTVALIKTLDLVGSGGIPPFGEGCEGEGARRY